ncbi:hypothetical protein ACJMK2_024198 [Sinanodonta woodiana]|uniref:Uncharacterized protein n=1 Tax=Sinanodonta woodiana TaxID=1069815 RepID=A0ABD3T6N7_SINWO
MGHIYKRIKESNRTGIDIQIYFKGIHVSSDSTGAPWSARAIDSSKTVNSSTALNIFSGWQKTFRLTHNLQYHFAMAITG